MASDEWTTMPLDEAVQINPRVLLERGEVYPFVDMKAVDPASRSVGPSEMREFKGGGSRFMNGDTLMARITPCLENGKIARFAAPDKQPMGHGSTEFIVIRGKPDVTDNDFAYYLTRWDGVRQYAISQMTGSSGRQRVPTNALTHLEVDLPPLSEQRAIACILGALDDKIELNRRMNETLEAMARAIFKSWFIDFDPVIDNALRAGNPIPESMRERAEVRRRTLDQNQPSPPPPLPKGEGGKKRVNYHGGFDFTGLVEIARELRKKQTPAEAVMWALLRDRRFLGLKFRRQHQIGEFVADFFCHEHHLVVELDGPVHEAKKKKDHKRDAYLKSLGFTVLRFPNEQVLDDPASVLDQIAAQCSETGSGSSPSGRGGGEGVYDLVRAKAKGQQPPLPAPQSEATQQAGGFAPHIADLFPDTFEESELGEIPKGWEVSTVGQHFHLTMGQSPPGSTYNETGEGLPFYQGRRDFGFRFPSRRVFCTAPTRFAEPGDTLVSVRAPVGAVNMASERCAVGRGVAAIRHRSGGRSFTYYSMHHLGDYFGKFEAEGTVFGSINKKDFEQLSFIAPSPEVLTAFDRVVSPLDDRIDTNERQTSILAALRDTLLPRLISGELRVPEAERIVGRCA